VTRTYRIHRGRDVYLAAFSAVWFAIVVGTAIHNAPRHWTAGTFATAVFALLFALVPAFGYALTPRDVTVYDCSRSSPPSATR
jgi:hypothetical protein